MHTFNLLTVTLGAGMVWLPHGMAQVEAPPAAPDQDQERVAPHQAVRWVPSIKFTVRAVDEAGDPIEGATAYLELSNPFATRPGSNVISGETDAEGKLSIEGVGDGYVYIGVGKEGFYSSGLLHQWNIKDVEDAYSRRGNEMGDARLLPWNPVMDVVLVEKKDPVTMKDLWGIRLPEFDREFGYDLLVGDLVAPHGEGVHADLLLRTELETFEDEMDIVVLEMEFTGQGNGMMRVEEFPFPDSDFKYLRQAPEDGYETRTLKTGRLNRGLHRQNPDAEQVEQLRELYRSKVPIAPAHPEAWVFRIRQDKAADGDGPHYGIFVKPSREGPPLRFNAATVAALTGTSAAPSEPTINLSIRGVVNPIVGSRSLEVGPPAPRDPRRMVLPPGVPPPPPELDRNQDDDEDED